MNLMREYNMDLLDKIDKITTESTFGKQKSKKWFDYRGKIVGAKSAGDITSLLHKMVKDLDKNELDDLTNQALAKMNKLK